MEVLGERVTGGSAAGDRNARPRWEVQAGEGGFQDYESLFRTFADQLLANKGSFKVDGSLIFEFVPKAHLRGERLISPETSFSFHRMQEGVVYTEEGERIPEGKNKQPAIANYHYQKNVPPLDIAMADHFMPEI